jgi:hypothetical protein
MSLLTCSAPARNSPAWTIAALAALVPRSVEHDEIDTHEHVETRSMEPNRSPDELHRVSRGLKRLRRVGGFEYQAAESVAATAPIE